MAKKKIEDIEKVEASIEDEKPKKATKKKAATKKAEGEAKPKKTTAKKSTAKKTAKKKEEKLVEPAIEEPAVVEAPAEVATEEAAPALTAQDYIDRINWDKGIAQGKGWLYIEVKAGEYSDGVSSIETVCEAMRACMLEGDRVVCGELDMPGEGLTVRYYCDNLSPKRKHMFA